MSVWTLCVLSGALAAVQAGGDMGPGVWSVLHVTKCESELHKFKFDILRHKINRTHDGFNIHLVLEETFNDKFGVRIDVCKYVDGGCKQYQVVSDDCFVSFVNKYAKNNVQSCLEMAGVDPPEFPVEKGEYSVSDYVFDYSELPSDGCYGTFCAQCYLLRGTEELGCVELHFEFKEAPTDDDDCDE